MRFTLEVEQEGDGRWIAEVPGEVIEQTGLLAAAVGELGAAADESSPLSSQSR